MKALPHHVGHTSSVPAPDVLVEEGFFEHILHVRDAACVPASDVLVKVKGVGEHVLRGRTQNTFFKHVWEFVSCIVALNISSFSLFPHQTT